MNIEYLVIGGGGGGGFDVGGGGGAGGYRCNVSGENSGGGVSAEPALTVSTGVAYVITIGAGGAGVTSTYDYSIAGSYSIFNNIVSYGGGGGAAYRDMMPSQGGSGGGSAGHTYGIQRGAYGTTGQGYKGGNGLGATYTTATTGGGGGGAGGEGANSANGVSSKADGGIGVASSITGSAVTRGVGGKGCGDSATGEADGSANTGGGGDGGGNGDTGKTGGSGVVILRIPDANSATFSGITHTDTTVTGYKIYECTAGTGTVTFS